MTDKILLVDDDENILAAYKRQLRKKYEVHVALGGEEGLKTLKEEGSFAALISDMNMPSMNGVEFLIQAKKVAPQTVRMMLTGNADQQTAIDAVNQGGVFRFLTKPASPEDLTAAIEASLEQHRLITAEKELLEKTLAGSIKVLTDVLSIIDQRAFGRAEVMRRWVLRLGPALELPGRPFLQMAAMLSRLGDVTLPNELRGKSPNAEALTDAERDMILRVPEVSQGLIANIPRMKPVADIVYYQSKRFDGGGFPDDKVAGSKIPLGSRLLKILSDLFDDCAGNQPSKSIIQKMKRDEGAYDPALLAKLEDHLDLLEVEKQDGEARVVMEIRAISLEPNDQLKADLESPNGTLILAAGQVLGDALIEKIQNLARLRQVNEPFAVIRSVAQSDAA